MRDMKSTKLMATHRIASARALGSFAAWRARTLRTGMRAKVSGHVCSVKRKTFNASYRRRKMGRMAFSPMETSPMMDSAPAIFRGYIYDM